MNDSPQATRSEKTPRKRHSLPAKWPLLLILGAAFLLIAAAVQANTPHKLENLVVNGSFEEPDVMPGRAGYFPDSIPGWLATSPAEDPIIEIQDTVFGWKAKEGSQYLELDAYVNTVLAQLIPTSDDQAYWISFYASPRPLRPGDPKAENGFTMAWNTEHTISKITDGKNLNQTDWVPYGLCVPGSPGSAQSLLEFEGTGSSNSFGTFIDSVSVEASDCQPQTAQYLVPGPGSEITLNGDLLAQGSPAEIKPGDSFSGRCPPDQSCPVRIESDACEEVLSAIFLLSINEETALHEWQIGLILANAGCYAAQASDSAAASIPAYAQLGLQLSQGSLIGQGLLDVLSSTLHTVEADVQTTGQTQFMVERDSQMGKTSVSSFSGEVTVIPTNPDLQPIELDTMQKVTLSGNEAGPVVDLQSLYLPLVQGS